MRLASVHPPGRAVALHYAPLIHGEVIERLGLAVRPGVQGLAVVAIDLDGPAAQGGVQIGDAIVGVNGSRVARSEELDEALGAAASGIVRLDLLRGGEPLEVAIAGGSSDAAAAEASWSPLGLQVGEVPQSAREALGVSSGVMVIRVRAPANRTRILPGDVIVRIGEKPVRNLEEFNRLVSERAEGPVGLFVRRADADLYIALEAGAGAPGSGHPEGLFRARRPATGTPLST